MLCQILLGKRVLLLKMPDRHQAQSREGKTGRRDVTSAFPMSDVCLAAMLGDVVGVPQWMVEHLEIRALVCAVPLVGRDLWSQFWKS